MNTYTEYFLEDNVPNDTDVCAFVVMRYLLNIYVTQDHIQAVDVLQEYHRRNRPNRPPNVQKLAHTTAAQHQVQQMVQFDDDNDNGANSGPVANGSDEEEEDSGPTQERARRHSKVVDGAAPKP